MSARRIQVTNANVLSQHPVRQQAEGAATPRAAGFLLSSPARAAASSPAPSCFETAGKTRESADNFAEIGARKSRTARPFSQNSDVCKGHPETRTVPVQTRSQQENGY